MSRIEHHEYEGQLEIRIKPSSDGGSTYFFGFWLVGWALGWIFAFRDLVSDVLGFGSIFLLVWITGWTLGGAFVGLRLAWKAYGFEQIVVTTAELSIKHNIFGYGPGKKFQTNQCRNLRAVGYFGKERDRSALSQIGMKGGVVAIDTVNDIIRFGVDLEETEALDVVALLRSYIEM